MFPRIYINVQFKISLSILSYVKKLSENFVDPGACLSVPGSPAIFTGLVGEPGAVCPSIFLCTCVLAHFPFVFF